VHIIRDFQKDRLNHLNYFPADLLDKYSITPAMLDSMAYGAPPAEEFRNLVRFYIHEADKHRLETLRMIEHVSPLLSIRYRLSLRIIFDLYLMVYNRIDPEKGSFTTEVLQPSAQDIKQQVGMTLSSFFQSP
jgi:phytoene/squalene synthetase